MEVEFMSKQTLYVNELTNGLLDPEEKMLGPLKDGGHIVVNTSPGCWGPMITPEIKGGHEVSKPVFIEGAEVGDALVIYIKKVNVTSMMTASGNERTVEGNFLGDPFVAAKCPECGTMNPKTKLEGTGPKSVRCAECGAEISPFQFTNGYTINFNESKTMGVTLDEKAANKAAEDAKFHMAIPDNSIQNPIVTFGPSDIQGAVARLRPFIGQLGTTPSIAMPDSHNAGDFGAFLNGAPHDYALSEEDLKKHKTDGHMDINRVREGAILVCPVKVKGGGVYVGDVHAMQGDGEIAGHTCDVSAIVELKVKVIKEMNIDGPILLPLEEDLPYLAKPITKQEMKVAKGIAENWQMKELEDTAPISFIGTGANLNEAIDNGLSRAADVLDMTIPEVKNRATINGSIEIGRAPGTVTVTFLAPVDKLKKAKLFEIVNDQYNR
jgi:acetamidase/formamidase